MNLLLIAILALCLSGCSSPDPWRSDAIASGLPLFDSQRLLYRRDSSQGYIEFFCVDNQISAYFSTLGRRFGNEAQTEATLTIGSEHLEETIPLHEGGMRTKLPDSWTERLIRALKDGQEAAIIVGAISQTIQPETFSNHFKQLAKDSIP